MKLAYDGRRPRPVPAAVEDEQPSLFVDSPAAADAVAAAPSVEAAWAALAPDDPVVVRLDAAIAALDTSIATGRALIARTRTAGEVVPDAWVDRMVALEESRLNTVWARQDRLVSLGHLPAPVLSVSYPTPLAARLCDAVNERTAEMVAWRHATWPQTPAYDPASLVVEPALAVAWEQLAAHAHGWDDANRRHWLRADVVAHARVVVCGQEETP